MPATCSSLTQRGCASCSGPIKVKVKSEPLCPCTSLIALVLDGMVTEKRITNAITERHQSQKGTINDKELEIGSVGLCGR